jgi:hypothetical protein
MAGILDLAKGRLPDRVFARVVLAIAVHAYFDQASELRRPPLISIVNPLLSYVDDPSCASAFVDLGRLLNDAGAELLHVPGQKTKVAFHVDLAEAPEKEPRLIRALKIAGQNVLVASEDTRSPRKLTAVLGGETCNGAQLRQVLAREYGIPSDALSRGSDKQMMKWDPQAGLAELDPDAPGGVSPLNDGEEA